MSKLGGAHKLANDAPQIASIPLYHMTKTRFRLIYGPLLCMVSPYDIQAFGSWLGLLRFHRAQQMTSAAVT